MIETFYLLVCRDCGNGELVMPFASAAERGKWAAGHTKATGHDHWFVRDEHRAAESENAGTIPSDEMTARTPKSPPASPEGPAGGLR